MLKEKMIAQFETADDESADLIADLLEYLLDPDDDEAQPSAGDFAHISDVNDQVSL